MPNYNPQDSYFKKAQTRNYRARSVFKLQELDRKFKLLYPNAQVLDVGAAPGSWLQYVSTKIGSQGKAVGLDLQVIKSIAPNILTATCDITKLSDVAHLLNTLGYTKFDLIISDAAPNTTGIAEVDHGKSIEITNSVFEIAKKYLKPKGRLIIKVFEGATFGDFLKKLKHYFKSVKTTTVKATRRGSREVYVICS